MNFAQFVALVSGSWLLVGSSIGLGNSGSATIDKDRLEFSLKTSKLNSTYRILEERPHDLIVTDRPSEIPINSNTLVFLDIKSGIEQSCTLTIHGNWLVLEHESTELPFPKRLCLKRFASENGAGDTSVDSSAPTSLAYSDYSDYSDYMDYTDYADYNDLSGYADWSD